jgi:hypothetical protein
MSHPHNGNLVPMQFPFFNFIDPYSREQPIDNEPPVRVKMAMEYLRHTTIKTMTRIVANDMEIFESEGQDLTTAESNAQASAANAVNDYIKGTLELTEVEKEDSRFNVVPKGKVGMYMKCFACFPPGPPNSNCSVCEGYGHILVFPARGKK